jgi:hypothetical protein
MIGRTDRGGDDMTGHDAHDPRAAGWDAGPDDPPASGGPCSVPMLLSAAAHMDTLADACRTEARTALQAADEYRVMADRLRGLATIDALDQEWRGWSGPGMHPAA